jgi:hypothetical protein
MARWVVVSSVRCRKVPAGPQERRLVVPAGGRRRGDPGCLDACHAVGRLVCVCVRWAVGGRRCLRLPHLCRCVAPWGTWIAAVRRGTARLGGAAGHDHPLLAERLGRLPAPRRRPGGLALAVAVVAAAACSSCWAWPAGRRSPAVAAYLLPEDPEPGTETKEPGLWTRPDLHLWRVGATGFEPVTSSVSAICREPLCGRPFPQVKRDRRCRSYHYGKQMV